MKSIYSKCRSYKYKYKSKHNKNYIKTTVCSRFIIYVLPEYVDGILIDIRYECIGSILYNVYLDCLFDMLINKSKNEIKTIIYTIESISLEYIRDINNIKSFSISIERLKNKLINVLCT